MLRRAAVAVVVVLEAARMPRHHLTVVSLAATDRLLPFLDSSVFVIVAMSSFLKQSCFKYMLSIIPIMCVLGYSCFVCRTDR